MIEKHNRKFTGVWIPRRLFDLMDEEKLNVKELVLLAQISSLEGKEGCFASSEYLGNLIGVSGDRAGRIISELKNKGLIRQVKFDGRKRWLKVQLEEPVKTKTAPVNRPKQHRSTDQNSTGQPAGATPVNRPSYNKGDSKGDSSVLSKDSTVTAEQRRSAHGFLSEDNTPTSTNSFETICSKKLHSALSRSNSVMRKPNITQWKKSFKDLVHKDGVSESSVSKVLEWFCNNLHEPYIPDARSGPAFRDKFDQIVSAMERSSHKDTAKGGESVSNHYNELPDQTKREWDEEIEESNKRGEKWRPEKGLCMYEGELIAIELLDDEEIKDVELFPLGHSLEEEIKLRKSKKRGK